MTKQDLLTKLSFGESIAEYEAQKLKDYFFETEYWKLLRNGTNDIIYGAKGSGKSALYMSISNDVDNLFDENIFLVHAENPSGNTAFSNLKNEPPTSESELIKLWKLYFVVMISNIFTDYDLKDEFSTKIRKILNDCELIPAQNRLSSILKVCLDFVNSFTNSKEISTTAEIDSVTGFYSGQKFSLVFGETSKKDFDSGKVPLDYLYELITDCLDRNNINVWIIIDRLDVAFIESEELETNALRALFKTYLDLITYSRIKLKIFLRDDIWEKITVEGFREASHITKFQKITWSKESLLNLIIRRILDNEHLVEDYSLDKKEILQDFNKQEELFYFFFPKQIDNGSKKPATIDWMLSRTKDGKGINTPRELIQLFNNARNVQIKKIENGIDDLTGNIISLSLTKPTI